MEKVKIFNNRFLSNIIKKIKFVGASIEEPNCIPEGLLVIIAMSKNMTNQQIIEKSIHSYEEIVDITQADDLNDNFDQQFILKEENQIDAMNEEGT